MTDTTWHAPADLIERYAANPSWVDDARAASLEAHLIGCSTCREALDGVVGPALAQASWSGLIDVIDQPPTRSLEWLLRRFRVPETWSRLLGATPGLMFAWFAAVAAVVGFVVVLSAAADATAGFLVTAPLVPLILVAGLFAPVSDPAGETGVATPLHGFGLLARRAVIVEVTAFALLALANVALGELGAPVAAWVLPSLALSVSVVALSTWVAPEVAATVIAGAWLSGVVLVWWEGGRLVLAKSATFETPGQVLWIVLLVLATVLVVTRRERFATMEVFG